MIDGCSLSRTWKDPATITGAEMPDLRVESVPFVARRWLLAVATVLIRLHSRGPTSERATPVSGILTVGSNSNFRKQSH